MGLRNFLSSFLPGLEDYGAGESFFFKKTREEQSKTVNILVGNSTLVKVNATMKTDYQNNENEGVIDVIYICKVQEIDGKVIPFQEQDEKAERLVLDGDLTPQLQITLLMDVLEKFGLRGSVVPVTDEFVSGHMRVIRLQERLAGSRQ